AAVEEAHALRMDDAYLMAGEGTDALQDAHGMGGHLGVTAEPRHGGVGPDHGQGPDTLRLQRQSAVVLEKNDALLRLLHGERAGLRVIRDFLCMTGVRVRVLEESREELEAQDAAHRRVDLSLRDFPLRERL